MNDREDKRDGTCDPATDTPLPEHKRATGNPHEWAKEENLPHGLRREPARPYSKKSGYRHD